MSTYDGRSGVSTRVRTLATDANPAFATAALLVPLSLFGLSLALKDAKLLFFTHVGAGALWFAVGILFPAIIGPVLGSLTPDAARQVNAKLVPKLVYFAFGTSLTTVLSGTVLADRLGYLDLAELRWTSDWVLAALLLGWGLFVFGLLVTHRLSLRSFYEGQSEAPDAALLERTGKHLFLVGNVEMVGMLAVVYVMTNLRL